MNPLSNAAHRFWLIAILTIANPLFHKTVSDICDWARARWGFAAYERMALIGIPFFALLAAGSALARNGHHLLRFRVIASLTVLAALSVAAQRWLMVVNIELIHMPQFGLVSIAALAAGFSPQRAFGVGVAAGIVDETYQHLVVYAGRSDTYFDINDIVLNAIGAAWAVVLFGRNGVGSHFLRTPQSTVDGVDLPLEKHDSGPHFSIALTLVLFAAAWWLDPPQFNPLFRITPASQKVYRVLSAPEGVVSCVVLWALVTFVGGRPTPRTRIEMAAVPSRLLCVIPMLFLGGCASVPSGVQPVATPRPPGASPLITTFWCGPPLDQFDEARAAQVAAAGFTIVGSPCEGGTSPEQNRRALDVAARHGLKMWIADPRFNEQATSRPDWEAQVAAAASEYGKHPALGGYFVSDEPSAAEFSELARIGSRLQADAAALAYINLLPDYVPASLGTNTYREYVEQFLSTVRPRLFSFDYYPFRVNGDRPTFFASLALLRELSQKYRVPFMLIVLAMPHGSYRDPTEAELSWQVFHALAFGARGISYFAYWTPVNVEYANVMKFRHGLIEKGRPTAHYYEAMRVNRAAHSIAAELASYRSVAVGDSRGEVAERLPIGPIADIRGASITVGLFTDDAGGFAALLVNRNYRRPARVTMRMRAGEGAPQRLDVSTAAWTTDARSFELAAGGAQLVRWPARH